jgi:hypothetical protein
MEPLKMRRHPLYRFGGHYLLHHLHPKSMMLGSLGLGIRAPASQPGRIAPQVVPHRQYPTGLARICPRSWLQSHGSTDRLPQPALQLTHRIRSAYCVETSQAQITMQPAILVHHSQHKIWGGWPMS